MKRLCVVLGMLAGMCFVPKAASAGTVTVIDPIIGVRGGMFGSEPVSSGNTVFFAECPPALDSFVQCAIFNISDTAFSGGITSIDLHLTSAPDTEPEFENEIESPSGFGFTTLDNGDLSFSGSGPLMCGDHICGTVDGEDIVFGLRPIDDSEDVFALNLSANVTAVNGTPLNSVPEPTTLLLLGTGVATLAGGRLRRKNS